MNKKRIMKTAVLFAATLAMSSHMQVKAEGEVPVAAMPQEDVEPVPSITEGVIATSAQTISIKKKKKKVKIKYKTGWTKDITEVHADFKQKSKVIKTLQKNEKVKFAKCNEKWYKIKYKNKYAYIKKETVAKKKCKYKIYKVPNYKGFKSWMPYKTITSKSSPQYKIQYNYAYTDKNGLRKVGDRYCVALGSYFKASMGTKLDLILANGTVIPCILSDAKANQHTDSRNIFSPAGGGCMSEFLVDYPKLKSIAKIMGNCSYCYKSWRSKVIKVIVYKDNILK